MHQRAGFRCRCLGLIPLRDTLGNCMNWMSGAKCMYTVTSVVSESLQSYGLSPSSRLYPVHRIRQARILAATAKSLQSCPILCDPIDGSPPGSPLPRILQARTLEWVAIAFSNAWKWKVKVKSLSRVRLLVTLWTAAHQAPPSMGFSRQEYWSGVPLPSPCISPTTWIIGNKMLRKKLESLTSWNLTVNVNQMLTSSLLWSLYEIK